jgi:hypothetical protein
MAMRAESNGTRPTEDAYIFSDSLDGSEPWSPQTITVWFAKLRDQAGYRDLVFNSLRHFMSSNALDMGFAVPTVAGRNGHDPSMLLRVYASRLTSTDHKLSAAMSDMLASRRSELTRREEANSVAIEEAKRRLGTTKRRASRAEQLQN